MIKVIKRAEADIYDGSKAWMFTADKIPGWMPYVEEMEPQAFMDLILSDGQRPQIDVSYKKCLYHFVGV